MSNGPAHIQTVSEAESSISSASKSTFASLANTLGLPQLRDSFFQNIIYILITIIIFVGILVYIQIVGPTGNDPLNSPPTREIKKVEIKRIVEGFELSEGSNSIANGAMSVEQLDGDHNYNDNDLHLSVADEPLEGAMDKKPTKKHRK
jgi:hypothetical protein